MELNNQQNQILCISWHRKKTVLFDLECFVFFFLLSNFVVDDHIFRSVSDALMEDL